MSHKRIFISVFLSLMVIISLVFTSVYAQDANNTDDAQATSIEFEGQITAINTNSIIVSGLTVILGDLVPDVEIVVGNAISVSGILQADGTIQATIIVIASDDDDDDDGNDDDDNDSEATPEATSEVTPELTPEVTQEPSATPVPDDDDDDKPIIVVYGPVVAININVVTVYNIDIELDDDDPVLTVIQIGDIIRVEGEYRDDDDDDNDDDDGNDDSPIVIVNIVNITFINVTVIIIDGQVWRDPGDCSGLPEWINDDDAVEYLVRCTGGNPGGGGSNNNSNNNNNGGGRGNNRGDNDDDDD